MAFGLKAHGEGVCTSKMVLALEAYLKMSFVLIASQYTVKKKTLTGTDVSVSMMLIFCTPRNLPSFCANAARVPERTAVPLASCTTAVTDNVCR